MSVSFISGRTKDSVHLVYKDHRFSRDRTRNDTIYWRCMMSRKTTLNPIICKARISTDKDGNIISVGQSHNHPPNKLEIQIRTCISDIKRLGVLHEKDQMDVSEKDLFKKLVENFPEKLKPERRKIRPRQQRPKLQRQDMRGHHAPVLSCGSQLEIGIPSRTMPTFSLAHLNNNSQFQLTVDMKPMVVEPEVSLPPVTTSLPMVTNQPAPSLHLPLQVSPHNSLQPHPAPHTPPLNSPDISPQFPLEPFSAMLVTPGNHVVTPGNHDNAAMLASLEKELLSLLDVEELSKLMPLLSGAVDKNTSPPPSPQPWAPEIERLFSEVLLRNPIA
ncbi:uncharacterized protein LOC134822870 [Bolinopsis microptera]|uniref:uncharacterized protein LOC134822870 n=1 Tax=Bolinopsis microptera TaxID=2820187 RepID=UPI00307A69D6